MSVTTSKPLPTLYQRPEAYTVIFDGKCGFCQHQMRRLDRWDNNEQVAYVSLHEPVVAERWPELSKDDLMREICVVTQSGEKHFGADAFRFLASKMKSLWPISFAMRIPFSMPFWRFVYRQFAKRRYRISQRYECTEDACRVHLN